MAIHVVSLFLYLVFLKYVKDVLREVKRASSILELAF